VQNDRNPIVDGKLTIRPQRPCYNPAQPRGRTGISVSADDGERWTARRIGAYELVELIGSGGMGEVYRARRIDAQYEKEVAIKLVPATHSAGFILQRMRAERQILAKLDHPNIARLIDGGATEDGLPYLIMDLVDGEPLDQYCERRQLPIGQRLRLFRDVCSAVSYAHQHLIVHRDLKPSNILVTADGTVKLLDFGIAKLLQPALGNEGAAPTVTGMSTMTLEFASPEQVLGKPITTASDLYSLGVVLYLLLTRHTPYRSSHESTHELMREVCETEPVRPSARVASENRTGGDRLDSDLDAITLRALRKEPERRYTSVDELSEDVRRYLEAMPVTAREGQLAYHAGKFLRRRKLEVAAAALLTASLVGGIITLTHQARLANQQRARAELHFASVRRLAEVSMFQLHDAIKDLPGSTGARELLVNTALEYLNALEDEAGKDRSLRHDLATAYIRVADIQGKVNRANMGKPLEAMKSYGKAIMLLEPLVAASPTDASSRSSLAQAYLQQSRLLAWQGDPKASIALSQRAAEMFGSLAAADPSPKARIALAEASRVHGINLVLAGNSELATTFADRAVAILEDLHRRQPDDLELAYELGVGYGTGADVWQADQRPQARATSYALRLKALAVDERLVASTGGRNAAYMRSLLNDRVSLCQQFNDDGDFRRAIDYCRAAQPLLAKLRTDDKNVQIELDGAVTLFHLGGALLGLGRLGESAALFEQNVNALRAMAQQGNSLQIQYLLAGSEEVLGRIESLRAANAASTRAERLRRWQLAKRWYEDAVPRFQNVAARLSLTPEDEIPIDNAIAGLAKSKAEIARLEAAASSE
jgi:eukaryotic-like serine/threonine-protein kinase